MESSLPRLIVIADGFTRPPIRDRVLRMADARALPWVQLRDHNATAEEFGDRTRELVAEIRRRSPETLISVNGYPVLAVELGVGLHLGFRSISTASARTMLGPYLLIGYSAHSDSHMSVIAHCHYVTYSPVFPVPKPTASAPLGLERLGRMARRSNKPVFALGSIKVDRVQACLEAGAYGVAALSGVMSAEDSVAAVRQYTNAIEDALSII